MAFENEKLRDSGFGERNDLTHVTSVARFAKPQISNPRRPILAMALNKSERTRGGDISQTKIRVDTRVPVWNTWV